MTQHPRSEAPRYWRDLTPGERNHAQRRLHDQLERERAGWTWLVGLHPAVDNGPPREWRR